MKNLIKLYFSLFVLVFVGCQKDLPEAVAGFCTDETACNYTPAADYQTYDNCEYAIDMYPDGLYDCDGACYSDFDGDGVCDVVGCMDETACNYNQEADVDDDSCEYPNECDDCFGDLSCLGCTDETACNYDAEATVDDGSCWFASANQPCECEYEEFIDFSTYGNNVSWSDTYTVPDGYTSLTITLSGGTESCCDLITINGNNYSGQFYGTTFTSSTINISFSSDGSVNASTNSNYGWTAIITCN